MLKTGWYKIEKYVRGGTYRWRVYVSKKTAKEFYNIKDLLEDIGENTLGGKSSGYNIYSRYFGNKKPKNTDLLLRKPITNLVWIHKVGEYSLNRRKAHEQLMKLIEKRNRRKNNV